MLSAGPEAAGMWFRKRKARDTRADLARAEESLSTAQAANAEQQRKRRREHEHVIRRINRIQQDNNIAAVIRQALQQHGGHL